MKRIAYFFLLIALFISGCASPPSVLNKISVQYKNSRIEDHILLSVHPKSLIVAPVNAGDSRENLLLSASRIPTDSIFRVYYNRKATLSDAIPGAVWGAPIGLIAGYIALAGIASPFGVVVLANYWMLPPILGSLIGGTIGYTTGDDDREFDPSQFRDYIALSKLAVYPIEEPPELQKIK